MIVHQLIFILISFALNIGYFASAPPSFFFMAFVLLFLFTIYFSKKHKASLLLNLLAVSIPLSFINISGLDDLPRHSLYVALAPVAFIVLTLILSVRASIKNRSGLFLVAALGLLVLFTLGHSLSNHPDYIAESLSSVGASWLLIVGPFLALFLAPIYRYESYDTAFALFILSTTGLALSNLIALLFYFIDLGLLHEANIHIRSGRISMGGSWSDFSLVAGLFAATIMASLTLLITNQRIVTSVSQKRLLPRSLLLVVIAVLFAGLASSGARAGFVALVLAFPVVMVLLYKSSYIKAGGAAFAVFVFSVLVSAVGYVIFLFFRKDLFSFSVSGEDRIDRQILSFQVVIDNFTLFEHLFGSAIGSNVQSSVVGPVTHNIFMELYISGGLIYVLFVSVLIVVSLLVSKTRPALTSGVITAFIALQFSPSGPDSRYLSFLFFLCLLYYAGCRGRYTPSRGDLEKPPNHVQPQPASPGRDRSVS